jgi:ATP-binding cassette subfamily C (CFTR/MRP) protein 1
MTRSDRRIKCTNESFNNIKMLKLYSWTSVFSDTLKGLRTDELDWLWRRFKVGQFSVTSLFFFPAILSPVVFAFYIGSGNYLTLDVAFTVITLLNMIKEPLRLLPLFVGSFLEFLVSMKRIQAFMMCDEVNATMIKHVDKEENPNSVTIFKGSNFHWGVKP